MGFKIASILSVLQRYHQVVDVIYKTRVVIFRVVPSLNVMLSLPMRTCHFSSYIETQKDKNEPALDTCLSQPCFNVPMSTG